MALKKKVTDRFHEFTAENYIRLALLFLATVFVTAFAVFHIYALLKGQTLYGWLESGDFFKKNGDIIMSIIICFCALCLLAIFVYTLFWKKPKQENVTKKTLVGRQIVEEASEEATDKRKQAAPSDDIAPIKISAAALKSAEKLLKSEDEDKSAK